MDKEQWFLRDGEQLWCCKYCGKQLVVVRPPKQCPVCGKAHSFVAWKDKNYPYCP